MTASAAYTEGYRDATDNVRRDLAAILRYKAVDLGDGAPVLSDMQVREIFAAVFGVKATDDEFGPEPSGKGVRAALGL